MYLQIWRRFFWLTLAGFVAVVIFLSYVKPARLKLLWKSYWFAPTALGYLAACRIVCVATELLHVSIGETDRQALLAASAMPPWLYEPLPILQAFLWPWGGNVRPSIEVLTSIHWLAVITGVTSLIGLRSNFSLLLFSAACTFLQAYLYSFAEVHHPEAVPRDCTVGARIEPRRKSDIAGRSPIQRSLPLADEGASSQADQVCRMATLARSVPPCGRLSRFRYPQTLARRAELDEWLHTPVLPAE